MFSTQRPQFLLLTCNCEEEKKINNFGIKKVDEIGKALEGDNLGEIKSSALAVLLLEMAIKQWEI